MYEEFTRPITDAERDHLLGLLNPKYMLFRPDAYKLPIGIAAMTLAVVASLAFFLELMHTAFFRRLGMPYSAILPITSLLIFNQLFKLLIVFVLHFHLRQRFSRKTSPKIRQTLQTGTVLAKKIRPAAVVEIAARKRKGPAYIFDLDNGHLLVLNGPDVGPLIHFPNTHFDIVRSTDRSLLVGIFCHGTLLNPVSILESSQLKPAFRKIPDEDLIPANLQHFTLSLLKST